MARRSKRTRAIAGAAISVAGILLAAAAFGAGHRNKPEVADEDVALVGEGRSATVRVELGAAVGDIKLTKASVPGRPIVVIDPGHGGRDPGATGVSGSTTEKDLALTLARELRDELADRGRVRVAMTRDDDRFLTLDQRAEIARKLGASAYLSVHIDSAPNPMARGATVYSLSDVASDAEAARFAAKENSAGEGLSTELDGSLQGMLSDLALREQMNASATFAERLVRKSAGRYLLRPEPHRFADFRVLRHAQVPAILFEAGYISNSEDEALLLEPEGRARIVAALAQAIEADVATRIVR
jgi:N-acetylmuramoyl-L-alanine amidase